VRVETTSWWSGNGILFENVAWERDFTSGIQSQLATLCEDYDNAVCAISEVLSQCQGIWPPLLHYSPLVS